MWPILELEFPAPRRAEVEALAKWSLSREGMAEFVRARAHQLASA